MEPKINIIPYWPSEKGYKGLIKNKLYEFSEPSEFLTYSNKKWPKILFKLELKEE